MHKTPSEACLYLQKIKTLVLKHNQKHFVFFPPALTAAAVQKELSGTQFKWGGQNCYFANEGAFTGENSPLVLKHLGAEFCLVGHSERRQLFLEDDASIHKKILACYHCGLKPILCVGETWQQKQNNLSFKIIAGQLERILSEFKNSPQMLYIAYEPVWAVGARQAAGVQDVQQVKNWLCTAAAAAGVKFCFLYGGSVSAHNIYDLFYKCELDGFLVGGAGLKPEGFFNLFEALKK